MGFGIVLLIISSILFPKKEPVKKTKAKNEYNATHLELSNSNELISIQVDDGPVKNIKLESGDWNKRFNTHSTDEVEGRYQLTTAFMERFLNLKTAFGTKSIKCAFYENKVVFIITNKRDMFEFCNIFMSLDNPKQVEHLFNQFISIFSMIEYFKLDQKTGL